MINNNIKEISKCMDINEVFKILNLYYNIDSTLDIINDVKKKKIIKLKIPK
jgi:hypothetical protein